MLYTRWLYLRTSNSYAGVSPSSTRRMTSSSDHSCCWVAKLVANLIALPTLSDWGSRRLQAFSCNQSDPDHSIIWRVRMNPKLNQAWWVLKIGLGLGPLLAGADKFFNLLTNWEMYLNPLVP